MLFQTETSNGFGVVVVEGKGKLKLFFVKIVWFGCFNTNQGLRLISNHSRLRVT